MKMHLIIFLACTVCFSKMDLNAQNVGIGTNAPFDKVTIQTASASYGLTHTDGTIKLSTFVGGSVNGGWLGTQSNHPLSFYANNSSALMSILPNGNVGIGVINPLHKLTVGGRILLRSEDVFNTAGIWLNNPGNTSALAFIGIPQDNAVGFYGNNGVGWGLMMNTITGNIGVGTLSPGHKMDIKSSVVDGNNNTTLLNLIGRNPVLSFSNENNGGNGYIKLWTNAPYFPFVNGMVVGSAPGNAIYLSTNYAATLTVGDNNNIGIWKAPGNASLLDAKLQVRSGDNNKGALSLESANGVHAWTFQIDNNTPTLNLYLNNILKGYFAFSNGAYVALSDISLKKDIKPVEAILDKVIQLRAYHYQYKDNAHDAPASTGFIAQDVVKLFPELTGTVNTSNGKLMGIDYQGFSVIAIKAIQEQQKIIETLQEQLNVVRKKLAELEKK